ncbi:diguanylate cyclase [Agrobacterium rhizogenes]|uniref:diguanylate cyclase domain-containing protein n=1 Tax=Rhizobium rhizogenes TaxID=359 RepID=UPI001574B62F|nr:diguanylate cyclase [Rhizobium rhizogenes]NTI19852.1 diguanylate cyclase [Rhizobium rhizogenes]
MAALVFSTAGSIVFANTGAVKLFRPSDRLLGIGIGDLLPEWPLAGKELSFLVNCAGDRRSCHVKVLTWPSATGVMTAALIDTEADDLSAGLAAREANLRLRYVIEMLPEAVCVFDAEDRYVLWNQKYAELYADIADHLQPGIPFEDILKISLAGGEMREIVGDKDAWLRERMRKFHKPVSQEEQQLRDGRWLRHDDRRTPDGGAIGTRIDITELKQREEWLGQLFDANPMPMLLCDRDTLVILQANQAAIDFYGFQGAAALSRRACDMHVEDEISRFAKALHELDGDCEARTVWRQHTADGGERHVLIYVRLLHEGAEHRLLLTIADVSDRIFAEAEANRLAYHDVLTGLPNRMQFYKALGENLKSNGGTGVAVFCLDLDGFKPVNDTFGHAAGDDVLKKVGERLQAEAQSHMVARLGGDEFAILSTGDERSAVDLAERCISAFEPPFFIKGLAVRIGVSIGIAAAPADGLDGEALVQEADRALYRAKADGRNTWRTASDTRLTSKQVKVR